MKANVPSDRGLRVENLTAGYGKALVVRGLSLNVGLGEIVGLCGRNGAGKTTTLRAITGTVERAASVLSIDGVDLPPSPTATARLGVAHVPEGRRLFGSLTVLENIQFGGIIGRASSNMHKDVERLCEMFPRLKDLLNRRAGSLSGGEQQIVAIARGMAMSPMVLLVDEVTLGLAPIAAEAIMEELREVVARGEMGVLLVDQNAKLLADECNRILVMADGQLREIAPNLITGEQDWLGAAYFGEQQI